MEQITDSPNFIVPDIEYEKGEVERVSNEVFSEQDTEKFFLRFKEAAKNAQLVDLSDRMWGTLENTDSYEIPPNGWEQVEEHAVGGHLDHPRDWKFYKTQYEKRATIKAPIIVKKGTMLHLVAGNTRLMVARALGIRPKVLLVELQ